MINRRITILTNGFNSASGGKRLFTKLLEILEKIGKKLLSLALYPSRLSPFCLF